MAITTDLNTDIGKVRFALGDDAPRGILPDGSHLSDEQVQYVLTSVDSVDSAIIALCDVLATRYANLSDTAVGPHKQSLSQISVAYATRAKTLRASSGIGNRVLSIPMLRVDGYSQTIPSNQIPTEFQDEVA